MREPSWCWLTALSTRHVADRQGLAPERHQTQGLVFVQLAGANDSNWPAV